MSSKSIQTQINELTRKLSPNGTDPKNAVIKSRIFGLKQRMQKYEGGRRTRRHKHHGRTRRHKRSNRTRRHR